jgi:hypothetical protein
VNDTASAAQVRPRRWRGPALVGAAVLAGVPLWALALAVVPEFGFGLYLQLSNWYYTVPRMLFGPALFPREEFGVIPNGAAGLLVAAVLFATVGFAVGCLFGALRAEGKDR